MNLSESENQTKDADIWTIKRVLDWSAEYLKKGGFEAFRLDAEVLLADTLKCKRIDLFLNHDRPLDKVEREQYKQHIKRRAAGEPVAYITLVKEFMSLPFKVTRDVLIPRPETELLVEEAIKISQKWKDQEISILDIGTGSGCIAAVLAKTIAMAKVSAWDISKSALAIAEENCLTHFSGKINFSVCDMLDEKSWAKQEKCDIVVSNPPYITEDEMKNLSREIADFEPSLALAAGEDGLKYYRAIAQFAPMVLKDDGILLLEIGSGQGDKVKEILNKGPWKNISVKKDYSAIDRMVIAKLN